MLFVQILQLRCQITYNIQTSSRSPLHSLTPAAPRPDILFPQNSGNSGVSVGRPRVNESFRSQRFFLPHPFSVKQRKWWGEWLAFSAPQKPSPQIFRDLVTIRDSIIFDTPSFSPRGVPDSAHSVSDHRHRKRSSRHRMRLLSLCKHPSQLRTTPQKTAETVG